MFAINKFNMVAKKRVKRVSKKSKVEKITVGTVVASQKKFNLIVSNLLLFLIIFVVSLGLYFVSSNEFYSNLFWMISLLTGFLSVALFLVYLIFLIMKYLGK